MDQERGLLMANLSHDLRTPITVIKGYVEGIQDGIAATEEKRRHYLSTIYNKTLALEQLVADMRDFSEYELGRMQYHFERVDLTALLKDELLRRDLVPFYGTAESHLASQNVALGAGFRPGFAYLYAKPKGT